MFNACGIVDLANLECCRITGSMTSNLYPKQLTDVECDVYVKNTNFDLCKRSQNFMCAR